MNESEYLFQVFLLYPTAVYLNQVRKGEAILTLLTGEGHGEVLAELSDFSLSSGSSTELILTFRAERRRRLCTGLDGAVGTNHSYNGKGGSVSNTAGTYFVMAPPSRSGPGSAAPGDTVPRTVFAATVVVSCAVPSKWRVLQRRPRGQESAVPSRYLQL